MNNKHEGTRELTSDELDVVVGGGSVSNVIDGIGKALERTATAGEGATITVFGVTIPIPPPK